GVVIHVRAVVDLFINNGEDASWRLAPRDAGRYGRAQDPAVRVVENDLLGFDRYDRNNRLTCRARRRRLLALRLFRRGAGSQRRQRGQRRERYDGSRPPMPDGHGGLRRRQSTSHQVLRLKSLSALKWIKVPHRDSWKLTASTITGKGGAKSSRKKARPLY